MSTLSAIRQCRLNSCCCTLHKHILVRLTRKPVSSEYWEFSQALLLAFLQTQMYTQNGISNKNIAFSCDMSCWIGLNSICKRMGKNILKCKNLTKIWPSKLFTEAAGLGLAALISTVCHYTHTQDSTFKYTVKKT